MICSAILEIAETIFKIVLQDTRQKMCVELLDRAAQLHRVLFTRDSDLLAEATRRQQEGIPFSGVIYAHQLRVSIGKCIEDLELIAKTGEPQDLADHYIFLPF